MKQITVTKEVNAEKVAEILWKFSPKNVRIDQLASCYYECDYLGDGKWKVNPKVYKYAEVDFYNLPKWVRNDMIGSVKDIGTNCPTTWHPDFVGIWPSCESNSRKAIKELKKLVSVA